MRNDLKIYESCGVNDNKDYIEITANTPPNNGHDIYIAIHNGDTDITNIFLTYDEFAQIVAHVMEAYIAGEN